MAEPRRIHPDVLKLMREKGLRHADARRTLIWARAAEACRPACFTPLWRWYYAKEMNRG